MDLKRSIQSNIEADIAKRIRLASGKISVLIYTFVTIIIYTLELLAELEISSKNRDFRFVLLVNRD